MTHREFRATVPYASSLEGTDCPGELARGAVMVDPSDGHEVVILSCGGCGRLVVHDVTDDRVRNDYIPSRPVGLCGRSPNGSDPTIVEIW